MSYLFRVPMPRIALNAVWNVIGTVLPMVAGLLSVPMLLRGLGDARLGVFSLALGLIGFAGIFDLGLGRALTQTVARETGLGSAPDALAELVRKALLAVLVLGGAWGGGLWVFSEWVVHDFLKLSGELGRETVFGIRWLALTLPVALLATSLIGVLEGLQKFKRINFLRVPLGVATFIVPALVALWHGDLGLTIAGLALVRLIALAAWLWCLLGEFDLFAANAGASLDSKKMWRFSGWLSITNLVGPLMVHADRFYLATLFPPSMVAYYTVPLDTMFRLTMLPSAAMNVVYPAMAHQGGDTSKVATMVRSAGISMICLWFLPVFVASLFLVQLLVIWLGADFGTRVLAIAQWLLVGMLANGFAHIPYALLQAGGRADITAKLHLIELPLYALAINYFVGEFGVLGAAMAWSFRVWFDMGALYLLAAVLMRKLARQLLLVFGLTSGAMLVLGLSLQSSSLGVKVSLLSIFLALVVASFRFFIKNITSDKNSIPHD